MGSRERYIEFYFDKSVSSVSFFASEIPSGTSFIKHVDVMTSRMTQSLPRNFVTETPSTSLNSVHLHFESGSEC